MSHEEKRYSVAAASAVVGRYISFRRPKGVRTYQPTYRLNPKKRFDAEKIEKVLKRVVDEELFEIEYSEKIVPDLCLNLSETIRNAVKEENYDRYRTIVSVTIGQRRQQGVHIFHTFLWDHERDAFASYNYENPHLFANVVVYAVYLD
ncbi:tctex1 domain-containing protein 1-B-like isoform X2 [Trichoplusia ni]|uniref:Tctex1 domain-containing protein 1-B-like isoform X2 n=1 Tax=Trichoplusia ni TaxID=7111 RepID=A0A7E5WP18_TRINI|nr:tctex1 domain-containing protein 1-B-like isoform X2 [Trichoplusia ni]